jgi:peptidoglycan/xylan/chitin deacetylase (PgdA/CDA1 family)
MATRGRRTGYLQRQGELRSSLSDDELERELNDSRDQIAARTGRPCAHFCYPFGNDDAIGARAVERVERVYASATTMTRGRLQGHRPGLLPRIPIYAEDTADVARLKILTP